METVVLVFRKIEFLDAVKEHCVLNDWPLPSDTFSITINQDSHLENIELNFLALSKRTKKLTKHKIIIDSTWFNQLVEKKYPKHKLPAEFILIKIGSNEAFDLCISFEKFSFKETLISFFKKLLKIS